ncbi:MAG: methylmalonic aciduria and homocystinuria type D protein [Cyanobacteria bacterium P01_E01_bin.35]
MTYYTPSGAEIEICITPPHQFARHHQRQLLPGWDTSLSYLIFILQRSSISFQETTFEVALEKNRLRARFIRLGCSLSFALQQQKYLSDLFDPLTGRPFLGNSGLTWDDNAAVSALLNYPVISYQNCTLLLHPIWKNNVYPATIVTSAPQVAIESCLAQVIADHSWKSAIDN